MADGDLAQSVAEQLETQADQLVPNNIIEQGDCNAESSNNEVQTVQKDLEAVNLQNSTEPEKVDIDSESDDEEEQRYLSKNGGLFYSDHNYDVPDKSQRAIHEPQVFPVIEGLDEFGNIKPPNQHLQEEKSHTPHPHPQHVQTQPQITTYPRHITVGHVKPAATTPYALHQDSPRTEPAIVLRTAARETFRGAVQSESVPAFNGFASAPRNFPQRQLQSSVVKSRAELTQSGQPTYTANHNPNIIVTGRTPIPARRSVLSGQTGIGPTYYQNHGTPTLLRRANIQNTPGRTPMPNVLRTGIRQMQNIQQRGIIHHDEHVGGSMDHTHHPQQQSHHPISHNQQTTAIHIPPQRRNADMAPHRMTLEQRQQQQQMVQSRPSMMEGVAPMLVGRGTKMTVRGRTGSQNLGVRRREDDILGHPHLSQHSVPHRSPQRPMTQQNVDMSQPLTTEQHIRKELAISPRKIHLSNNYSAPLQNQPMELPAQLTEDPIEPPPTPTHSVPVKTSDTPRTHVAPIRNNSPMKPLSSKPTPPHRMTQEEKSAHIAKHLEKDPKQPVSATITTNTTTTPIPAVQASPIHNNILPPQPTKVFNSVVSEEDQVASVVADVAAAASAASVPNPATSHHVPTQPFKQRDTVLDAKEQDEIQKLAKDLQKSAESFTTEGQSHDTLILTTIEKIKNEINKEKVVVKPEKKRGRQSLDRSANVVGGPSNVSTIAATTPGQHVPLATPSSESPLPRRGRPKGSVGSRAQFNASKVDGENQHPTNGTTPRTGQGVRTLPPMPSRPQRQATEVARNVRQKSNDNSDSESDGVRQSEAEYGDWVMRCHCGMDHGNTSSVECEKCKAWQHMSCMGIKPNTNTAGYNCELCRPRPLPVSKAEAIRVQKKELAGIVPNSENQERRNSRGRRSATAREQTSRRAHNSIGIEEPRLDSNDYSNRANRLLKTLKPTAGAKELLKDARKHFKAKKLLVEENAYGLVAHDHIELRAVVIELCGYVCLPDECRERGPGQASEVFQYDGLMKGPSGEDVGEATGRELVCIDARRKGNDSKFTRRSCKPNCVLKHVLDEDARLGIMLVATRDIDYNTEITLPFESDYFMREVPYACADHSKTNEVCPIEQSRRDYRDAIQRETERIQRVKREEQEAAKRLKEEQAAEQKEKKRKEEEEKAKADAIAAAAAEDLKNAQEETPKTGEVKVEEEEKPEEKPSTSEPPSTRKRRQSQRDGSVKPAMTRELASIGANIPVTSSEKTKLSREELKVQQYEEIFQRAEEAEKRRQSKGKSGKTPAKKNSKKDDKPEDEEEEAEVKKEEVEVKSEETVEKVPSPVPVVEKRTSKRVANTSISSSTSETVAHEKSTPSREVASSGKKNKREAEIKSSNSKAKLTPPIKKWKDDEEKEAAAILATVATPSSSNSRLGETASLRRKSVAPKRANTENLATSPLKRGRKVVVEEKQPLSQIFSSIKERVIEKKQAGPSFYDESLSFSKIVKPSKNAKSLKDLSEPLKKAEEEAVEAEKKAEADNKKKEEARKMAAEAEEAAAVAAAAQAKRRKRKEEEEAAAAAAQSKVQHELEERDKRVTPETSDKKEKKKLSYGEYMKRKSTAVLPAKEKEESEQSASSVSKRGFIPSTEEANSNVSLAAITLESEEKPTTSFGAESSESIQASSFPPLSSRTRSATSSAFSSNAPMEAASEPDPHSLSLADRFSNIFGT